MNEKKSFKYSLYLLPLLVVLAHARSAQIQTVSYDEGVLPDEDDATDSSEMEDIPPREEWFRVRGVNRNSPQRSRVSQQVSLGERNVLKLSSSNSNARNSKNVIGSLVEDSRGKGLNNDNNDGGVVGTKTRSRTGNDNDRDQLQVHVRSRGRIGFQQNARGKNTSEEEQEVFTQRIGDNDDGENDWKKGSRTSMSGDARKQQNNGHRHTRHGHEASHSGGSNRKNTRTRSRTHTQEQPSNQNIMNNENEEPREPEEEDFNGKEEQADDDNDNNRKQDENVESEQPNNRQEDDGDYDAEYGTEDLNDYRVSNRKRRPVKTQAVRIPPNQRRVIKTSRDGSNQLNGRYPPPHDQVAKMARYIVHNSNWTTIATKATMSAIRGYPFANVLSVSDGPIDASTGVPYMYTTPLDMSVIDLQRDSRASLTMTLAQSDYCREQKYDPEDPRCAKAILSGRVVKVNQPKEREFAMNALFSRHPDMPDWPKDHGWYFAKLSIEHIVVLDYFGGGRTVDINDYFNQSDL